MKSTSSKVMYYLKKQGMSERGCFIRIGSASEPMPVRMIEDLFWVSGISRCSGVTLN